MCVPSKVTRFLFVWDEPPTAANCNLQHHEKEIRAAVNSGASILDTGE